MKVNLSDFLRDFNSKQFPDDLEVIVPDKFSRPPVEKDLLDLAEALKSKKCPKRLNLNLTYCLIKDKGFKIITDALKSGKCPRGLKINVSNNLITDEGLKDFSEALKDFPKEFSIDLSSNDITEKGIENLGKNMKSKRFPSNLPPNLTIIINSTTNSIITNETRKAFAEEVLIPGVIPRGLRIQILYRALSTQHISELFDKKLKENDNFYTKLDRFYATTVRELSYIKNLIMEIIRQDFLTQTKNYPLPVYHQLLEFYLPKNTLEEVKFIFRELITQKYQKIYDQNNIDSDKTIKPEQILCEKREHQLIHQDDNDLEKTTKKVKTTNSFFTTSQVEKKQLPEKKKNFIYSSKYNAKAKQKIIKEKNQDSKRVIASFQL